MNRRDFLALLGCATLTSCGGDGPYSEVASPGGASATDPAGPALSKPELHFLTADPGAVDYRPAIGPDGATVVFERTLTTGEPTTLFTVSMHAEPPVATPFVASGWPAPLSQTRPAWCWQTGEIAFNGAQKDNDMPLVWLCAGDGGAPHRLADTLGFYYPQWSEDGTALVCENSGPRANISPCNTQFGRDGTVLSGNISGMMSDSAIQMYGGMPGIQPGHASRIAFAGQPSQAGWLPAHPEGTGYDQNFNYIFLNELDDGMFHSRPLEPAAPLTRFDPRFQARAPAWSPDGRTIVFESDRDGGKYALYMYNLDKGTVTQVTEPTLGAQHAKFFPDGKRLILSAYHPSGEVSTRGIAWIGVESLL